MIGEYLIILLIIIIIAGIIHTLFLHNHSSKRVVEPVSKHQTVETPVQPAKMTYWGKNNDSDLESELRAIDQQLRELDHPKAEPNLQPLIKHTHNIVKKYLNNYDANATRFTATEDAHDVLIDIHNKLREVGVDHHINRPKIEHITIEDEKVTEKMLLKIVSQLDKGIIKKTELYKIEKMLRSITQ